jgi:hypothetical protein
MATMWPHFVNLLSRSWDSFLHAMGTTGLGFFTPLVVFVLTVLATLGVIVWKQGKDAMKQHWKQSAAITTGVTLAVMLVVYSPIFLWNVVKTVYSDHEGLTVENTHLMAENSQTAKRNSELDSKNRQLDGENKTLKGEKGVGRVQSQLDILIEVNKRLPTGDRARLTEALFDFGRVLDEANSLWGKANNVNTELSPKDFESCKTRLRELLPLAKNYERDSYQVRQKWHYYERQIVYVFGDNPDNDAAIIQRAATEYLNYLNSLGQIQSAEDRPILEILFVEQNQYGLSIARFVHWKEDCQRRLEQMRNSVQ